MLRKVHSAASLTRSGSGRLLDATAQHVHKHLSLLRTDSSSDVSPSGTSLPQPWGWGSRGEMSRPGCSRWSRWLDSEGLSWWLDGELAMGHSRVC